MNTPTIIHEVFSLSYMMNLELIEVWTNFRRGEISFFGGKTLGQTYATIYCDSSSEIDEQTLFTCTHSLAQNNDKH